MANYARVVNNVAVDVSPNPTAQYHPSIASQFTSVPDTVQVGWSVSGSTWSPPAPPPSATPTSAVPFLTPIQFKMCFTPGERVEINGLKDTDSVLKTSFEILDDSRLTQVDLTLNSVQQMIDYVRSLGIISEARASEVKRGVIK